MRRDMHVWMLLPEDLCNRSPGLSELVIRQEAPSPLPSGGLTDGLLKLTRQRRVVVAPGYRLLLLLLFSAGSSALPGGPFRLNIPHYARMEISLLEVHPPGDPCPDFLVPADAQRLCKNDVSKDKVSLRVATLVK